jgi:uncharacterized OB-fold protein
MTTVPIADGLFTWPDDDPALIGGQCGQCATFTFPLRPGCPRCGADSVQRCLLHRHGTLWSWTTQGFVPKPPFAGERLIADPFQPWLVGVVELPDQLRLESILVGVSPADVRIGMPVRLTTIPLRTDDQGREVITFAFTPEGASHV